MLIENDHTHLHIEARVLRQGLGDNQQGVSECLVTIKTKDDAWVNQSGERAYKSISRTLSPK
jgi:hypothetical protein